MSETNFARYIAMNTAEMAAEELEAARRELAQTVFRLAEPWQPWGYFCDRLSQELKRDGFPTSQCFRWLEGGPAKRCIHKMTKLLPLGCVLHIGHWAKYHGCWRTGEWRESDSELHREWLDHLENPEQTPPSYGFFFQPPPADDREWGSLTMMVQRRTVCVSELSEDFFQHRTPQRGDIAIDPTTGKLYLNRQHLPPGAAKMLDEGSHPLVANYPFLASKRSA